MAETEVQEFPVLLPRQQEAYDKVVQTKPGDFLMLGYGGAMGGGKSIFLSSLASQLLISYPGTRILLCRDTLKSLKDSVLIDFLSILPRQLIEKHNHSENFIRVRRDTWPPGVYSQINFLGVHDYEAIGSAAYQAILIDEAHEVSNEAARFLFTRLRWKLPKSVSSALARQCRHTDRVEGLWLPCQNRPVDGVCPQHGTDWVSEKVPYLFVATANPWPGWYTDLFWKKEGAEIFETTPGTRVEFVQGLMADNSHLPDHYKAALTARLSPDERRRFIDGEFGVFSGMVYEAFDKRVHAWWGPVPQYTRVIGGLDFGQESSTAHHTAGTVFIITPSKRVMLVDEFKRRGPKVYEEQGLWMIEMQKKWGDPIGRKIEWRGDKSQSLGIKYLGEKGFHITKSNKSGQDRIDVGIKHFATLLNYSPGTYPSFFYLPEGHDQGGCPQWEEEIKEYRRDPETMKIIKENDHLLDSTRYAMELFKDVRGDPSQFTRNALPVMA